MYEKEDLPIIFPRFVGCRPPATGCTHIRIQSSRVHRELFALLLFLYFFSSFSLPLVFTASLYFIPLPREREFLDSLFSFLSFSLRPNGMHTSYFASLFFNIVCRRAERFCFEMTRDYPLSILLILINDQLAMISNHRIILKSNRT